MESFPTRDKISYQISFLDSSCRRSRSLFLRGHSKLCTWTKFWRPTPLEWKNCGQHFVHVTKHGHSTDHLPTSSCPRSYWMSPFFATKTKLLSLVLQTTFLDSKRWLTMIISKMFLVPQESQSETKTLLLFFLFFVAVSHSHFSSTNHWNKKNYFIHILTTYLNKSPNRFGRDADYSNIQTTPINSNSSID